MAQKIHQMLAPSFPVNTQITLGLNICHKSFDNFHQLITLQNLYQKITFGTKKKWSLKRGSIHMKFSMTGQEKCDLSIQVTA